MNESRRKESSIEKLLMIHALGWIVGVSIFGVLILALIESYK